MSLCALLSREKIISLNKTVNICSILFAEIQTREDIKTKKTCRSASLPSFHQWRISKKSREICDGIMTGWRALARRRSGTSETIEMSIQFGFVGCSWIFHVRQAIIECGSKVKISYLSRMCSYARQSNEFPASLYDDSRWESRTREKRQKMFCHLFVESSKRGLPGRQGENMNITFAYQREVPARSSDSRRESRLIGRYERLAC